MNFEITEFMNYCAWNGYWFFSSHPISKIMCSGMVRCLCAQEKKSRNWHLQPPKYGSIMEHLSEYVGKEPRDKRCQCVGLFAILLVSLLLIAVVNVRFIGVDIWFARPCPQSFLPRARFCRTLLLWVLSNFDHWRRDVNLNNSYFALGNLRGSSLLYKGFACLWHCNGKGYNIFRHSSFQGTRSILSRPTARACLVSVTVVSSESFAQRAMTNAFWRC